MKNIINKTYSEDAKLIRLYGETFRPDVYLPKTLEIEYLDQQIKLLNDLEEEKRRYALKLKTLRYNPQLNPDTDNKITRKD